MYIMGNCEWLRWIWLIREMSDQEDDGEVKLKVAEINSGNED